MGLYEATDWSGLYELPPPTITTQSPSPMFSVKATYRGEIRKFSFNTQTFPAFEQLYNQLHRVFPSSHNYYLSKLLFSPDASQPARILMAQEIHSADDYDRCLLQYKGRSWPNALLRFSIFDETPHKTPSNIAGDTSLNRLPDNSWSAERSYRVPSVGTATPSQTESNATPQPFSSFYIPPPPIVFSMPPRTYSRGPMDVDPVLVDVSVPSQASQTLHSDPPSAPPPSSRPKPNLSGCCSVAESKAEIKMLLQTFQQDLDCMLNRTFGRSSGITPMNMTAPTFFPTSVTTPFINPFLPSQPSQASQCSACASALIGRWYICINCSAFVCSDCCNYGKGGYYHRYGLCPASMGAMGTHILNQASPMPPSEQSSQPSWVAHPHDVYSPWSVSLPPLPPLPTTHNNQAYSCCGATSPVKPFIPPLRVPSPERSFRSPTLGAQYPGSRTATPPPPPPPPPPIIHEGVICDICDKTIEGARHKCLDCPDYDLCTTCISSQAFGGHNPHHKFLDILEPTRIVVHTVYDENTPREPASDPRGPVEDGTSASGLSIFHEATCDLCDSAIRGDRYKCTACPDFDTCRSCFTITNEQHPKHSFVRLSHPNDFIRRNPPPVSHLARCDACGQKIHGVRYKCMHRDCPDVDLCERCEALPIAQHPDNHPLLKMKTLETAIPTVYRTPTAPVSPRRRTPTRRLSRSPSFERGYMHNPASHSMRTGTCSRSQSPSVTDPSLSRFGPSPFPPPPGVRWSHPYGDSIFDSRPHIPHSYQAAMTPIGYAACVPSPIGTHIPNLSPVSPPPESPAEVYVHNLNSFHSWSTPILPGASTNSPPTMLEHIHRDIGLFNPRSPSPIPSDMKRRSPSPVEIGCDIPGHFPMGQPPYVSGSIPQAQCNPSAGNGPWFDFHRSLNSLMQHAPEPSQLSEPSIQEHAHGSTVAESSVMGSPLDDEALLQRPSGSDSPQLEQSTIYSPLRDEVLPNRTQSASSPIDHIISVSPLQNEALLNRPLSVDSREKQSAIRKRTPSDRSLSDVLSDYRSISPSNSGARENVGTVEPVTSPKLEEQLSAGFIEDLSFPNGQTFLPGVTFIKIWRMVNNGTQDWPQSTKIVFVGGARMTSEEQMQLTTVGSLKPGEEKHIWSGELKAPETPGKFTSYWRLRDDKGQLFGDTIWADIEVVEPGRRSTDENLSSSSIIVMPDISSQAAAPAVPCEGVTRASTVISDETSDDGVSDSSSVSLISVPSSDDEDDPTLWADSRAQATTEYVSQAMEYVMLYDDNTSSEDE